MVVSTEIWRCRIGGFNASWTNMAARMWKVETGLGSYKMWGMMFVFLLLIILSNDVETNPGPGPNTRGKQTTIEESQSQNTSGEENHHLVTWKDYCQRLGLRKDNLVVLYFTISSTINKAN